MNKAVKIIFAAALCAALSVSVLAFTFTLAQTSNGIRVAYADEIGLRVSFIDCGQADSCYIEFPDGKNMLIDAGENKSESYGSIIEFLDGEGVTTIDYFIMTHSDSDHIGGAVKIFEEYEIGIVYRPHQQATGTSSNPYTDPALKGEGKYGFYGDTVEEKATATYANAMKAAYAETSEVYVFNPFDEEISRITDATSTYTFDFLSPINTDYSDSNDYSPIMVLSYAGRDIVMTGDAEKENEADFVEYIKTAKLGDNGGHYDRMIKGEFNADIVKAGHHGSSTSTSEAFLNIMCANEAKRVNCFTIFSCGTDNTYGHPHIETLTRVMDMGFSAERLLRTDLNGDIRFGVSSEGKISVSTEKDADVTAKLTSGHTDKRPTETAKDNGLKPNEAADLLPDKPSDGCTSDNELFDPESWKDPTKYSAVQWLIIAAAVIVIVLIIVIAVRSSSKRRRRRRR